jgi:DNA invertase Pin-like site-specific DNA recombinase
MSTDSDRKAIGYVRQSRGRQGEDEDSSLSLGQQEETIREWAKRNAYTIVGIVKDFDETGRTMDRPGFLALREAVRPDMTVVTYKYDRFARNLIGQELAVEDLEALGVEVRSITEPPGKLPRQLLGSIAEYYSDQLSERLTAIRSSAAHAGRYTAAKPAFGYRRSKVEIVTDAAGNVTERRSGPIELDPERAPIMADVFARIADGHSAISIITDLRTRGYFHGSNAHVLVRMIQNPVYYGAVRYRGAIVATGTHPAIVTEDLWQRANERMANHPSVRRKPVAHWAEGLVYHACGRRMYLDDVESRPRKRDGIQPQYLYYRCVATSSIDACGIARPTPSANSTRRSLPTSRRSWAPSCRLRPPLLTRPPAPVGMQSNAGALRSSANARRRRNAAPRRARNGWTGVTMHPPGTPRNAATAMPSRALMRNALRCRPPRIRHATRSLRHP